MLDCLALNFQRLLQLRVFGFGLLENGNVRVGVFPQCEEILVGRAGLGCVARECIGAGETEMPKRVFNS
jgi:hypothetical protein